MVVRLDLERYLVVAIEGDHPRVVPEGREPPGLIQFVSFRRPWIRKSGAPGWRCRIVALNVR
jgi:hypothetical protein